MASLRWCGIQMIQKTHTHTHTDIYIIPCTNVNYAREARRGALNGVFPGQTTELAPDGSTAEARVVAAAEASPRSLPARDLVPPPVRSAVDTSAHALIREPATATVLPAPVPEEAEVEVWGAERRGLALPPLLPQLLLVVATGAPGATGAEPLVFAADVRASAPAVRGE